MDKSKPQWQSDTSQVVEHIVHHIRMSDVDDPELFIAQPIYEWQQTEKGKYIMEHSMPTPVWSRCVDYASYGYDYKITAFLTPSQLTYYKLRFE